MLLVAIMQTGKAQVAGTPYIGHSHSGDTVTMGTDFWLVFTRNSDGATASTLSTLSSSTAGNNITIDFFLNIATELPNTVTISFTADSVDGAPRSFVYNLAAGELRRIRLDSMRSDGSAPASRIDMRNKAYVPNYTTTVGGTAVNSNSVHITSTQPVSVQALNAQPVSTDATMIYPVGAWGTEYYPISYYNLSQVGGVEHVLIANSNNTQIYVNGGKTPIVTLNAGQVYDQTVNRSPNTTNDIGNNDITGIRVTSTKPVAYFASATIFTISGIGTGDLLDEQMVPVREWDKQYFVPNCPQYSVNSQASGAVLNNRIRIVASQDGTVVNYAGATSVNRAGASANSTSATNYNNYNQIATGGVLNAGQFVELVIDSVNGGAYITADKPIGVASYLSGGVTAGAGELSNYNNQQAGDPDNAVIPGVSQLTTAPLIVAPFMFPLAPTGTTSNLSFTRFASPPTTAGLDAVYHAMVIVTATADKGSAVMTKGTTNPANNLLNGITWIDDTNGSGMSFCVYRFNNVNDIGSSFIISAGGRGAFALGYGLANAESYMYNAGSDLFKQR